MALSVKTDHAWPGGGFALLEGAGLEAVTGISIENCYSKQFLAADGRWGKSPDILPVETAQSGALMLGPHIVDHVPTEMYVALRAQDGRELGKVFWVDVMPSRNPGSATIADAANRRFGLFQAPPAAVDEVPTTPPPVPEIVPPLPQPEIVPPRLDVISTTVTPPPLPINRVVPFARPLRFNAFPVWLTVAILVAATSAIVFTIYLISINQGLDYAVIIGIVAPSLVMIALVVLRPAWRYRPLELIMALVGMGAFGVLSVLALDDVLHKSSDITIRLLMVVFILNFAFAVIALGFIIKAMAAGASQPTGTVEGQRAPPPPPFPAAPNVIEGPRATQDRFDRPAIQRTRQVDATIPLWARICIGLPFTISLLYFIYGTIFMSIYYSYATALLIFVSVVMICFAIFHNMWPYRIIENVLITLCTLSASYSFYSLLAITGRLHNISNVLYFFVFLSFTKLLFCVWALFYCVPLLGIDKKSVARA